MKLRGWLAAAPTIVLLAGCTNLIPGHPVAADGAAPAPTTATTSAAAPPPQAAALLTPTGAETPAGIVAQSPVGVNYFTSADPPDCAAAILFVGSPLIPPGSVDHAETSYTTGGAAMMAESVDVYTETLDPDRLRLDGFTAVSKCTGEAVGNAPQGPGDPMSLTQFSMAGDGVLVWTMSRPDWTCDYGMVAVEHAVLMLSLCDAAPGFPMEQWATQRREQLLAQDR